MSTSDIERLAKRLFPRHVYGGYDAETKARMWQSQKYGLMQDVRAVLKAIREPTDPMENAMIQCTYGAPTEDWAHEAALHLFCAEVADGELPYCPEHAALAWQPGTRRPLRVQPIWDKTIVRAPGR